MPGTPTGRSFDRMVVLVLDSVGCGEAPDAAEFFDVGANTLARVITEARPRLDNLERLGLDWIEGVPALTEDSTTLETPLAAWGRMTQIAGAKDTLSGHWELMCVASFKRFPVYPDGFPEGVIARFEQAIGRSTLGNYPASGTDIIDDLGEEHLRSGSPIVYTSGDSVFQLAAHEEIIEARELYEMCTIARDLLSGPHRVARVIARPFIGNPSDGFVRTSRRQDFALPPPHGTALDLLTAAGHRTHGIGKIHDIFAGRGLSSSIKTVDNADGIAKTIEALQQDAGELIFVNLVDFDSAYGHRRDIAGYAAALAAFDEQLPDLVEALGPRDCLMITADHGNDPGFRGTDHTRERVPLLVVSQSTEPSDLGTRPTFADLGQTVLDNFGLRAEGPGTSFLAAISGAESSVFD